MSRIATALAGGVLLLTGCNGGTEAAAPETATAIQTAPEHHQSPASTKTVPLRPGERRLTVRMPESYTPSAPTGTGTDDYRCFLLDPQLDRDAFLTGTDVLPGDAEVVHHVILFRVSPERVAEAKAHDAATDGLGWTCFGGTGVGDLSVTPWLGAWAPGGGETVAPRGYGVELPRGSRIVMQVHYNLLAGSDPDRSATRLRLAPRGAGLTPLHTYLLPAPVELPCRRGHDSSPLCDRAASLADARARFGSMGGVAADVLHLLCSTPVRPGPVQSCTREAGRPMTVLAAAGHMHLLGRRITITTNPGTPRARTVLDVQPWDFDDQGSRPVRPVHLSASDTVQVTCRHAQWLRDELPAFDGQQERYVVWGEGTTDEMCLGMLSVAYR